jgi:hypothetical protein
MLNLGTSFSVTRVFSLPNSIAGCPGPTDFSYHSTTWMIYLTRAVYKIRRTTPKRKPRSVSWDIDHRRLEYKTVPHSGGQVLSASRRTWKRQVKWEFGGRLDRVDRCERPRRAPATGNTEAPACCSACIISEAGGAYAGRPERRRRRDPVFLGNTRTAYRRNRVPPRRVEREKKRNKKKSADHTLLRWSAGLAGWTTKW